MRGNQVKVFENTENVNRESLTRQQAPLVNQLVSPAHRRPSRTNVPTTIQLPEQPEQPEQSDSISRGLAYLAIAIQLSPAVIAMAIGELPEYVWYLAMPGPIYVIGCYALYNRVTQNRNAGENERSRLLSGSEQNQYGTEDRDSERERDLEAGDSVTSTPAP